MYAIINTDGHQRRVSPGEIVWLEKQDAQVGDTITIDNVLLVSDGQETRVGAPALLDAKVEAKVLRQLRDRKVVIGKYKRRKGYTRKKGHRHSYTEARVTLIRAAGMEAVAPAPAVKAAKETDDEKPVEQSAATEKAPSEVASSQE